MGKGIILAAPQIVEPARSGTEKFISLVVSNATVANLLIVLGGGIIAICVGLLIWRRVNPSSTFMQQLNSPGNHTALWCGAFILLGVVLILPLQIVPFVVQIFAAVFQVVLNIFGAIFGF